MSSLLIIIVFASAFPIGYLLAYLGRDEIVAGRMYFIYLGVVSIAASVIVSLINVQGSDIEIIKIPIILTMLYISITSFISAYKSYDKKFCRIR
jgi:hypothetical protein